MTWCRTPLNLIVVGLSVSGSPVSCAPWLWSCCLLCLLGLLLLIFTVFACLFLTEYYALYTKTGGNNLSPLVVFSFFRDDLKHRDGVRAPAIPTPVPVVTQRLTRPARARPLSQLPCWAHLPGFPSPELSRLNKYFVQLF